MVRTCDVNHPEFHLRPAPGPPAGRPAAPHPGCSCTSAIPDPCSARSRPIAIAFTNAGCVLATTLVYAIFVGGHTYAGMLATRVWPKLCPLRPGALRFEACDILSHSDWSCRPQRRRAVRAARESGFSVAAVQRGWLYSAVLTVRLGQPWRARGPAIWDLDA